LNVLEFTSLEKMQEKIDDIMMLKEINEAAIIQKLNYNVNNSDCQPKTFNDKGLTYEIIKNDLELYHREKLEGIYSLRKQLGFTSLQSIADEINSLKLLNPSKADYLFGKYSKLLKKSKFYVITSYGDIISNVLNVEGEVKVQGDYLNLDEDGNEGRSDYFFDANTNDQPVLSEYDDNGGGSVIGGTGTGIWTNQMINDEGYFSNSNANSDNIMMLMVWSVGRKRNTYNLFYRYDYFARITGFFRTSGNTFVSYPITFEFSEIGSDIEFKIPGRSTSIWVKFARSGTGSNFFNYQSRSSSSYRLYKLTLGDGTYSAVFNGQTYTSDFTGLLRYYPDYNPNEDPVYD
jgi:hypothetical protein